MCPGRGRPFCTRRAAPRVAAPAYDDMVVRARLAQAFGRLIRRREDRGMFVLLSSATPSRLLRAFPPGVANSPASVRRGGRAGAGTAFIACAFRASARAGERRRKGAMKSLTLLRHAKSGWDDRVARDYDRPLNPRGRRAARLIGETMRADSLTFDLVLVSPAARARETVEEVAESFGPLAAEYDERLYLASPATLLDIVHHADDRVVRLLIVGHNPGLEALALQLTRKDGAMRGELEVKYPTGTLAEMSSRRRIGAMSSPAAESSCASSGRGIWIRNWGRKTRQALHAPRQFPGERRGPVGWSYWIPAFAGKQCLGVRLRCPRARRQGCGGLRAISRTGTCCAGWRRRRGCGDGLLGLGSPLAPPARSCWTPLIV